MVDEYRMSEKRAIRWRKAILIPDYILRRLGEEKRRSIGAAPSRHANRFECVEVISHQVRLFACNQCLNSANLS
jgi:hypothetical protein